MPGPVAYEARKASGVCTKCGVRPATRGLHCDACRVWHRAYHHERRRIHAQLRVDTGALDVDLADLRRRSWVDGCTPCDEDPVCLALIAAHGPMTLDEIAAVLMRCRKAQGWDEAAADPSPVRKERVRQIEASALGKLRRLKPELAEYLTHRAGPRSSWEAIGELEAVAW